MTPGAKAMLIAACFVVICAGIKLAAPVLVPLLLASFIAIVTAPLVSWFVRKGSPRPIAILVALLVDVSVVAALATIAGSSVNAFYARIPHYQASLASGLHQAAAWLAAHEVRLPNDWVSRLADPAPLLGTIAALLRGVASLLSNLVLVLLIVAFMLVETTGLKAKLQTVLERPEDFDRLRRASEQIDRYLVFKTAISLFTGLLLGLWNAFLQVDLPVLWGLLAFLLNYIPTVGSLIAAGPPVLLTLVSQGPAAALILASGYFATNFAIGNVFEPRIMGRALGLSPLMVLLSIVLWGWLLGPMGALLSVPLTMVLKIFLDNHPELRRYAVFLGPPVAARAALAASETAIASETAAETTDLPSDTVPDE